MPFSRSAALTDLALTGRYASYDRADTWFPTWADDGHLYSPWTDGSVSGVRSSSQGTNPVTGQARIIGDDPLDLVVEGLGVEPGKALPYAGRYPCGSLVHNGVWYYGTSALGPEGGVTINDHFYNWAVMGPFMGFRISKDYGKTWEPSPHNSITPMFPDPKTFLGAVRIGTPHFVDFGRNMQHSPDGYAYLVAHGTDIDDPYCDKYIRSQKHNPEDFNHRMLHGLPTEDLDPSKQPPTRRPAGCSWISGDLIFLLRVKPSPQTINDAAAYEFFAGHDAAGRPIWTSDFARLRPLIDWRENCGCVTVTYNAPLNKYIMCVTDGWPTVEKMNTYLLEADALTGPWRLITYMKHFGEQAYFVNFPSKFISPDGGTAWLCCSGNFSRRVPLQANPMGTSNSLCLHEVRLLRPTDPR